MQKPHCLEELLLQQSKKIYYAYVLSFVFVVSFCPIHIILLPLPPFLCPAKWFHLPNLGVKKHACETRHLQEQLVKKTCICVLVYDCECVTKERG